MNFNFFLGLMGLLQIAQQPNHSGRLLTTGTGGTSTNNTSQSLSADETEVCNRVLSQFPKNVTDITCQIIEGTGYFQSDAHLDFKSPEIANKVDIKAVHQRKTRHHVKPKGKNLRGLAEDAVEQITTTVLETDTGLRNGVISESSIAGQQDAYRAMIWDMRPVPNNATGEIVLQPHYSVLSTYEINNKVYHTIVTLGPEGLKQMRAESRDAHPPSTTAAKLSDHDKEVTAQFGRRLSAAETKELLATKADANNGNRRLASVNADGLFEYHEFVAFSDAAANAVGGERNLNAHITNMHGMLESMIAEQLGKPALNLVLNGVTTVSQQGNFNSIQQAFGFANGPRFPRTTGTDISTIMVTSDEFPWSGIGGIGSMGYGMGGLVTAVTVGDPITFGHEHMHNFWAGHDDANAGQMPPDLPYARAYYNPNTNEYTMMGYGAAIFRLSQEGAYYQGQPIGDHEHNNFASVMEIMAGYAGVQGYTVAPVGSHGSQPTPKPTTPMRVITVRPSKKPTGKPSISVATVAPAIKATHTPSKPPVTFTNTKSPSSSHVPTKRPLGTNAPTIDQSPTLTKNKVVGFNFAVPANIDMPLNINIGNNRKLALSSGSITVFGKNNAALPSNCYTIDSTVLGKLKLDGGSYSQFAISDTDSDINVYYARSIVTKRNGRTVITPGKPELLLSLHKNIRGNLITDPVRITTNPATYASFGTVNTLSSAPTAAPSLPTKAPVRKGRRTDSV